MQVLREVEVRIEGKTSRLKALFDSGSSLTVMGYERLREAFGEVNVKHLVKPREVALLNGQKLIIDGYIDSLILIDEYLVEDRIYLARELAKEVVLEGERKALPDLIIGAPTLETWGIELDLKEGRVVYRGIFII